MFAQDRSWSPNSMAQRLRRPTKTRKPKNAAPVDAGPSQAPPGPQDSPHIRNSSHDALPVVPRQPAPAPESGGRAADDGERRTSTTYSPIRLRRRGSSDTSSADSVLSTRRPLRRIDNGWPVPASSTDRSPSYSSSGSGINLGKIHSGTRPVDMTRAARTKAGDSPHTPTPESRSSQSDSSSRSSAPRRSRPVTGTRNNGIMTSIEEEEDEDLGTDLPCDFCGSDLTGSARHECRDCPFCLCSVCIDNVEITHPGHSSVHRSELRSGLEDIQDTGSPRRSQDIVGSPDHAICEVCEEELVHMRYECQQCPNTNLCEEHRDWHISGHTLVPVYRPPVIRTSPKMHAPRLERRAHGHRHMRARAGTQNNTPRLTRSQSDKGTPLRYDDEEVRDGLDDEAGGNGSDMESPWEGIDGPEDDDTWDGFSNSSRGSADHRDGAGQSGGSLPDQSHFTLTLPVEGQMYLRSWAEAMLKQLPKPGVGAKKLSRRRPWRPIDKKRLQKLKTQGRTNEEIAAAMGRSVGAIVQQWRKQG